MSEQKKQWLMGVTWNSIVEVNRNLCVAQKLEPTSRPKVVASVQAGWEKASRQTGTLLEAFDACRSACEAAPFVFNNGNTFAAIARSLVDDALRTAPPVEAQILRTTIGHYVAGTVGRRELKDVLGQLSRLLVEAPARPAPSASADAPAGQALTEARPVA